MKSNSTIMQHFRRLSIPKSTVICLVVLVSFIPLLSPGGVSINFLFLLLLFFCPVYKIHHLPFYVLGLILTSITSYGLAFVFSISDIPYLERHFLSFIAFFSFLLILLVRIPVSIKKIYQIRN